MSEIVKGWARYEGSDDLRGDYYRMRTKVNDATVSSWLPVILVPDDGTRVIVTVEEVTAQFAAYDAGQSAHTTVGHLRAIILGEPTEGGGAP